MITIQGEKVKQTISSLKFRPLTCYQDNDIQKLKHQTHVRCLLS